MRVIDTEVFQQLVEFVHRTHGPIPGTAQLIEL